MYHIFLLLIASLAFVILIERICKRGREDHEEKYHKE